MKTFYRRCAQGEIQVTRIGDIGTKVGPSAPMQVENGKMIIGHSETGHNHILEKHAEVRLAQSAPPGMGLLYAILAEPNALIHERSFDTHEPIALMPGVYEFRITREYDPYEQIARQQAD